MSVLYGMSVSGIDSVIYAGVFIHIYKCIIVSI
jgi:hypothetical protein